LRGEPIKRRDHGEETLAEIGRSYNERLDDCAARKYEVIFHLPARDL
jgi:hypothetical protein